MPDPHRKQTRYLHVHTMVASKAKKTVICRYAVLYARQPKLVSSHVIYNIEIETNISTNYMFARMNNYNKRMIRNTEMTSIFIVVGIWIVLAADGPGFVEFAGRKQHPIWV